MKAETERDLKLGYNGNTMSYGNAFDVLFTNSGASTGCPVDSCALYEEDCLKSVVNGPVWIEGGELKISQNKKRGYASSLCMICKGEQQEVQQTFKVTQNDQCKHTLTDKQFTYDSSASVGWYDSSLQRNEWWQAIDGTSSSLFFGSTEACPITNCELKTYLSACEDDLGVNSTLRAVPSADSGSTLPGFEVQFFPQSLGFSESICLVCGNAAGETHQAELVIIQDGEGFFQRPEHLNYILIGLTIVVVLLATCIVVKKRAAPPKYAETEMKAGDTERGMATAYDK